MNFTIDQVWMAVSVDDEGAEGVCAILLDDQWMPLIAADEYRLDFIREQARQLAVRRQCLIRIVKMTGREVEAQEYDGRS